MLIDTHCHLNDDELYKDISLHLHEAKDNGVDKFIVCGWDYESSVRAVKIASENDNCFAAIGLHPENVCDPLNLDWIKELAQNEKVIAIGEIGLDYHYTTLNKEFQKKAFLEQIKIAQYLGKPIIVHIRDAIQDSYDLLKGANAKNGVIHCFSGSLEMARNFLDLGFYLGIGGVITFKNSHLKEVVKEIGIDRIISETDCPYLAPVPHRGEVNSPKYIKDIVLYISNLLNVSESVLEKKIENNVRELFNI